MIRIKHSNQIPTHHQRLSRQHVLGVSVCCFVLAAMVGAVAWGVM